MPASMALIRAMRNGCSPRLFGMGSKVDEKTLCTESADKPLANATNGGVDIELLMISIGDPIQLLWSPKAFWWQ